MAAADRYFEVSGRRLTYEYVLLADINDQPQHARELATLLRGRTALLNVIPYNRIAGLPYKTPTTAAQQRFREILETGKCLRMIAWAMRPVAADHGLIQLILLINLIYLLHLLILISLVQPAGLGERLLVVSIRPPV